LTLPAALFISARLSFWRYTDDREDYVYVQTFKDIDKLTGPLFKLVKQDPVNYQLKGHIIMDSSYPLPWILGDFPHVGYYEKSMPDDNEMDAAFLLVDDDHEEKVQKALKKNYFIDEFHLRNSQEPVNLYLSYNTFHQFFPNRKPDFVQGVAAPADDAGQKK
jgi:hypothetical protein